MQNEWKRLKARYETTSGYENRKVLKSKEDFEDFTNWLVDMGAEILTGLKQDECLRFRMNGVLGIMWGKGSGNLLAHDMGITYYCANDNTDLPRDNSNFGSFDLPIQFTSRGQISKPIRAQQRERHTHAVPYEYCASCKEVEPHNFNGSCSVCSFYSNPY